MEFRVHERKTIAELLALYELEPTLKDVYVEGPFDRTFLQWFLGAIGLADVIAYEIDTVEVPAALLAAKGLGNNNRGRVIALAEELQAATKDLSRRVACVVDADFDYVLGSRFGARLLLVTDYGSLELYCFNEHVLEKFLKVYLGDFPMAAGSILLELSPVLQELFLVRLTNSLLGLGLQELDFERCCSVKDRKLSFDLDDYVHRYLNKNAQLRSKSTFLALIEEMRPRLVGDLRCFISGRDFCRLFLWYAAKLRRTTRTQEQEAFSRSLFACVEREQLEREGLFKELAARLGGR